MNNENNVSVGKSEKKSQQKKPFMLELFDYLEIFVFAAAIVLLLFTFNLRLCRVDGDSMYDTLENGQMLLVSDIAYTPENGDIVVFHQSENKIQGLNKPLVKRVIATENQYFKLVYYREGIGEDSYLKMSVYVSNDEIFDESDLVNEDYIDYKQIYELDGSIAGRYLFGLTPGEDESSYSMSGKVPEGKLFIMGDNRYNSNDSRLDVGYIDARCVLGKVIFRITPPGKVD